MLQFFLLTHWNQPKSLIIERSSYCLCPLLGSWPARRFRSRRRDTSVIMISHVMWCGIRLETGSWSDSHKMKVERIESYQDPCMAHTVSVTPTPDVVASKVYFPEEESIRVHQMRTVQCPVNLPNGFLLVWSQPSQSPEVPKMG